MLLFLPTDVEVTRIPWQYLQTGAILQCSRSRRGLTLIDQPYEANLATSLDVTAPGSSRWLSNWEGDPEGIANAAPPLLPHACGGCLWVLVSSINPAASSLSPSAPFQCRPVHYHAFTGVGREMQWGRACSSLVLCTSPSPRAEGEESSKGTAAAASRLCWRSG